MTLESVGGKVYKQMSIFNPFAAKITDFRTKKIS